MGLFRAALLFIIGNFSISLIKTHSDKTNQIPIIGEIFGDEIKKYIKKNECMALLIILTLVEFIL